MEHKTITAMLEEQMNKSDDFTDHNFGLKLGSDYPELAREILESNRVAGVCLAKWVTSKFEELSEAKKMLLESSTGPAAFVRQMPGIYEHPLSFFYWGLQVGRELERREQSALAAVDLQSSK